MIALIITTTHVDLITLSLVGQTTRPRVGWTSLHTSSKNAFTLTIHLTCIQGESDSNTQPTDLESVALTNWSYRPNWTLGPISPHDEACVASNVGYTFLLPVFLEYFSYSLLLNSCGRLFLYKLRLFVYAFFNPFLPQIKNRSDIVSLRYKGVNNSLRLFLSRLLPAREALPGAPDQAILNCSGTLSSD